MIMIKVSFFLLNTRRAIRSYIRTLPSFPLSFVSDDYLALAAPDPSTCAAHPSFGKRPFLSRKSPGKPTLNGSNIIFCFWGPCEKLLGPFAEFIGWNVADGLDISKRWKIKRDQF
jgi:hypothetical protein